MDILSIINILTPFLGVLVPILPGGGDPSMPMRTGGGREYDPWRDLAIPQAREDKRPDLPHGVRHTVVAWLKRPVLTCESQFVGANTVREPGTIPNSRRVKFAIQLKRVRYTAKAAFVSPAEIQDESDRMIAAILTGQPIEIVFAR